MLVPPRRTWGTPARRAWLIVPTPPLCTMAATCLKSAENGTYLATCAWGGSGDPASDALPAVRGRQMSAGGRGRRKRNNFGPSNRARARWRRCLFPDRQAESQLGNAPEWRIIKRTPIACVALTAAWRIFGAYAGGADLRWRSARIDGRTASGLGDSGGGFVRSEAACCGLHCASRRAPERDSDELLAVALGRLDERLDVLRELLESLGRVVRVGSL